MCKLPYAAKSRKKTELTDGQILELAYNLVPGLESLPGVFGEPGGSLNRRRGGDGIEETGIN